MANERTGTATVGPPYLIHTFEHRAYPLNGEQPFVIGRDTSCDILVNEVTVSRRHAELRREGDGYVLYPAGSTPTLLNDAPLTGPHILQEGDNFLIGTMRFVFTSERLPVGITVAQPAASRSSTGVDDRRPTITFPIQEHSGKLQKKRKSGRWAVWLGLAAALGAAAYFLYAGR